MAPDVCLSVAGSHVISETLDGETVVINLETGVYYSLGGSASEVWEQIAAASTRGEVAARLARRYEVDAAELERTLDDFLDEVERDGLLRREPAERAAPAASGDGGTGGDRLPFVPPTVQRFTDIQDLLLLDPIHEVDDQGWPHPRTDE